MRQKELIPTLKIALHVIRYQGIASFLTQAFHKLKRSELRSAPSHSMWEAYSYEAGNLARTFDFTRKDVETSTGGARSDTAPLPLKDVNWFIPGFENVYWGGIHTILRFAEYLRSEKSVRNRIIAVWSGMATHDLKSKIARAFPNLTDDLYAVNSLSELDALPYADASVCTFWTTAYFLLRFGKTRRKFYFIQDFEPLFYPAGSTYAQVEATYTFGFHGIANTTSLAETYRSYGGVAEFFNPCVDTKLFHPAEETNRTRPFTVFFYGRPGHPRNCFELGTEALKLLKRELGNSIRIVCAGGDWRPGDFGLDGIIDQLGMLQYSETAELYRNCDVGVSMMVTRHPSYIPLQLMASGCLVISNRNPYTTWLLKDGDNCILAEPSITSLSQAILTAYKSPELRSALTTKALQIIRKQYSNWDSEFEKIYEFMIDSAGASSLTNVVNHRTPVSQSRV